MRYFLKCVALALIIAGVMAAVCATQHWWDGVPAWVFIAGVAWYWFWFWGALYGKGA